MCKIVCIYIGARFVETVYSVVEINSEKEQVEIPTLYRGGTVTRIGFKQMETKDHRSDYEKWKDEYYYSYYPTMSDVAVEVAISPNIKKIFIPNTITHISKLAFSKVKDITFEIDKDNKNYKIEDDKIIEISTGATIWPCNE